MIPTQTINAIGTAIQLNDLPEGAKILAFGHRSGTETHQRCPRAYFLNYEYLGHGITATPGPIYFAVGSAVHVGLGALLLGEPIDEAVGKAVMYLMQTAAYQRLLPDQQVEQEVLVHGLIYAFDVYAMPSMRANYEVICVETGAVEFVPLGYAGCDCGVKESITNDPTLTLMHDSMCGIHQTYIAIQSRPDAILRHRKTGEVSGWSWKTIDDPTDMRRSQLHNDLQGYMEMYYGERILEKLAGAPVTREEVTNALHEHLERLKDNNYSVECILEAMHDYSGDILNERVYAARNIPTQIDSIQTVFLVKGKRKLLEESEMPWIESASYSNDTDEFGGYSPDKIYKQMSHLCYRYRNSNVEVQGAAELYKSGPNKGKPKPIDSYDPNLQEESWAWRFFKPGNSTGSSLSSKWLTSPIQPDQIREWIDRLNTGTVYPSNMRDDRNPHPLEKLILFETPLYRNAVKAVGHVKQTKERYVQIAKNVEVMREEGCDNLEALDSLFPQHLINCRTPFKCQFFRFCHTPDENQLDFRTIPEGFELRTPHHAVEKEMRELAQTDGAGE